jgi:RHS repeat-associated protein
LGKSRLPPFHVALNADYQPTQTVDRDGRTINNTYDPAGRLTNEVWLAANGSQADALAYTFDHADNLTAASNNYGSYTFTLDAANRTTQQVDPFNLTLNFTEDPNGNVTQITDSTGGTETSVYNGDNLLTSRRLSGGPNNAQLRIDLSYTPDNQLSLLSRYSDTAGNTLVGKTQNTWDAAGNLSEVKHTNAANTVLEDFTYTWNAANLLSSETDTISGTPTTTNYTYDVSNQLTGAGGGSYSFDANGNRTLTGYQTGPANQLTTDGNWNDKYDPEGNLIEKDGVSGGPNAGLTWKYGYDNLNHLVSAAKYSGGTLQIQVGLSYDVFGNLVEEDITQGSTTVIKFAYNLVSGNGNSWADLNSSNQVQTRREYLDAMDAVFARIASDGTEAWYLTDHLGSVRGLMNNSGSLVDTLTTDAWGNITSESSPSTGDRFKFGGGQWDATIALEHFGERWYDPMNGRWISQDPLGLAADSNPYRDVANNPTNATDPSGLEPAWNDPEAMFWEGVRHSLPYITDPAAILYAARYFVLGTEQPGLTRQDIVDILGKPPEPETKLAEDELGLAVAVKNGTAFGLKLYGADQTTTEEGFKEATRLVEEQFPQHTLKMGVAIVLSQGEARAFGWFLRALGKMGKGTYRFVKGRLFRKAGDKVVEVSEQEANTLLQAFENRRAPTTRPSGTYPSEPGGPPPGYPPKEPWPPIPYDPPTKVPPPPPETPVIPPGTPKPPPPPPGGKPNPYGPYPND